MRLHMHKWAPVYKKVPARPVVYFGLIFQCTTAHTGIERCRVCGRRQKDRSASRMRWTIALIGLASASVLTVGSMICHGHPALGGLLLVAGVGGVMITLVVGALYASV